MKPTLTLITILIAVAVSGQVKKDTIYIRKPLTYTTTKAPTNWYTNNKNTDHWQYNNGGSQLLYSIKPDGTIELGDLLIDAVVKGLEKKGYVVKKKKRL